MIENIFLMTWNPSESTLDKQLVTQAAYPEEQDRFNVQTLREKIFRAHRANLEKDWELSDFTDDFLHNNMIAITVDGLNILSVLLPYKNILGLVFFKKENPNDYRNELIRLLMEYFLAKFVDIAKERQKQTLLLTLFVDLRKFSDDQITHQEEVNRIMILNNTPMIKVFVFGLDFAGKSSLMRFLATGKFDNNYFPPTRKFRITNIKLSSGVKLVCWDMPGQMVFRKEWLRGAQSSNILLYVLDSADTKRFEEAHEELLNMLDLYELQNIPLLFFVNKIDLPDAVKDIDKLLDRFELSKIANREVKIVLGSVLENLGISDAIQWMEQKVQTLLISQNIKVDHASEME